MKSKTLLLRLGALAIMTGLMSCCAALRVTPESPIQSTTYLQLKAGQTYQPQQAETWVSLQKYESLEKDLLDAVTANKELRYAR